MECDDQKRPKNVAAKLEPNRFAASVCNVLREAVWGVPFRGRARLTNAIAKAILGKRLLLLPLRGGSRMVLDTGDKYEVLMYLDLFSHETQAALKLALRPGDVFMDCGSNVGFFAFKAAALVGEQGKVIAIDANPDCIERLRQSKELGGHRNVSVVHAAVVERPRTITLNIAGSHMFSSICDVNQLAWTTRTRGVQVCGRTLDEIVAAKLPDPKARVRLVKLDIEGAEIAALQGANESLSGHRFDYIYAEIHPIQLANLGHQEREFHAILHAHGYRQIQDHCKKLCCVYASPAVAEEPSPQQLLRWRENREVQEIDNRKRRAA